MRLRTKAEPAVLADRMTSTGSRELIGSLLVEAGAISEADVRRVLERQEGTNELFGQAAIALGLVSEADIRAAIERQQSFFTAHPETTGLSPLLVTAFDPDDSVSQEVRRLRGEISRRASTQNGELRTIALLGFGIDAERSVIAANLAVSFAQAGYRTLLVDAALDGPNLHGLFDRPSRRGVSTFLSSDVDGSDVIQPTEVPNLSLMAAGPSVPNISELFDRRRLFQRLRPLGQAFDMVLVEIGDGSAVAAAEGADGAIIVARRGDADLKEVKRVAERLQAHGTGIVGSVIVD